ncbi:MAG: [FeFe] hydrogenase H-cluster maturation GTPase HydF [Kiritimatiellales bacterium]
MNITPKSFRLHIALFGRTNTGKSSFLNLIAGQEVSIVSEQPGTTTDTVEKTMELPPFGPVVLIDTAGIDDSTALAGKRLAKTEEVFNRADIILLICEGTNTGKFETAIKARAAGKNIPVICIANKSDQPGASVSTDFISADSTRPAERDRVLAELKSRLLDVCPDEVIQPPPLVSDLIPHGGLALFVAPIDAQAPKGRLILPQVSAIRDALDGNSGALIVKETEYTHMLNRLKTPPDIVICDSQVVKQIIAETPAEIPCTTFSILFARLKGDLSTLAAGAAAVDNLKSGDGVLIAESCTHHAADDDIGRVKIPRWLREYTGADLQIDVFAGRDFPVNLNEYKLVVQCGGCMHNRREILSRIERCAADGVPITNYGLCISKTQGVLNRVLEPFKLNRQDAMKGTHYERTIPKS